MKKYLIDIKLLKPYNFLFFVFQFDVFDYDNDGSHDLIGTFVTTITAMSEAIKNPVS